MAEYTVAGLDVNDTIARLCKKWGVEIVHGYLRDWVAYMDRQMETMDRHGMLHNDGEAGG